MGWGGSPTDRGPVSRPATGTPVIPVGHVGRGTLFRAQPSGAGKRRKADAVLRNARDSCAVLGARTYVERCDRALGAGGPNTVRATAAARFRVSPPDHD
jgi:hypothetical protein